MAQRSLFYLGNQFPMCARDTGIAAGFLLGLLAVFLANNYNTRNTKLKIWILFLIPIGLDGLTQYAGLRESTNSIRLLTGLPVGFLMSYLLIAIFSREREERLPSNLTLLYSFLLAAALLLLPQFTQAGVALLFWLTVVSIPFTYAMLGVVVVYLGISLARRAGAKIEEISTQQ